MKEDEDKYIFVEV